MMVEWQSACCKGRRASFDGVMAVSVHFVLYVYGLFVPCWAV